MRNLLTSLLLILLLDLIFQGCANTGSPTGGPRDTIPPILLNATPTNGTVNYKEQEFTLEFSEFVKADKIQQQLIITPQSDNKYKTIVRKNTVTLRFEEPFPDSTTYNLNFADAVTDITENNPAVNLSLAFSTGPYIDSMSISGIVIDLFKQEEVEGYTVGLYPNTDTLDYFTDKPLYFTTTNDSGQFNINYVKAGVYQLLAFNDDNSNITFDPETEQHGFVKDSINLFEPITLTKPIATLLQNIKPITFINSRPTGPYIELKYSKTIDSYNLTPEFLKHSITGESRDVIRIYKHEDAQIGDTLQIISTVRDSLLNETIDTIRTAFIESNRKPSEFNYSIKSNQKFLVDNYPVTVSFSKPVYTVDSTKIQFIKDSTFALTLDPTITWNDNHTLLSLNTNTIKQELLDTLISLLPKDTTEQTQESRRPGQTQKQLPPIELLFDKGVFLSLEGDTSKSQSITIPLDEPTSYGIVKIDIQTDHTDFTLQLLDGRNEAVYSIKNEKEITFPKVTPGKYSIRVLIDNNADGKWSAGNLLLNRLPEDLYLHEEETSVRENWDVTIDISF